MRTRAARARCRWRIAALLALVQFSVCAGGAIAPAPRRSLLQSLPPSPPVPGLLRPPPPATASASVSFSIDLAQADITVSREAQNAIVTALTAAAATPGLALAPAPPTLNPVTVVLRVEGTNGDAASDYSQALIRAAISKTVAAPLSAVEVVSVSNNNVPADLDALDVTVMVRTQGDLDPVTRANNMVKVLAAADVPSTNNQAGSGALWNRLSNTALGASQQATTTADPMSGNASVYMYPSPNGAVDNPDVSVELPLLLFVPTAETGGSVSQARTLANTALARLVSFVATGALSSSLQLQMQGVVATLATYTEVSSSAPPPPPPPPPPNPPVPPPNAPPSPESPADLTNVLALGSNIKAGNDSLLAGVLFGCILGVAFLGVLAYSAIAKARNETGPPPIHVPDREEKRADNRLKLKAIAAMGGDPNADVGAAKATLRALKAAQIKEAEDAAFKEMAGDIAHKDKEIEHLRKKIEAVKAKAKAKKAQEAAAAKDGELRDSAEEAPRPRKGGKGKSRIPSTDVGRGRRYEEQGSEESEEGSDDERRRRRKRSGSRRRRHEDE